LETKLTGVLAFNVFRLLAFLEYFSVAVLLDIFKDVHDLLVAVVVWCWTIAFVEMGWSVFLVTFPSLFLELVEGIRGLRKPIFEDKGVVLVAMMHHWILIQANFLNEVAELAKVLSGSSLGSSFLHFSNQ
jgi:hypothetical protein